jgi:hypothetical protein
MASKFRGLGSERISLRCQSKVKVPLCLLPAHPVLMFAVLTCDKENSRATEALNKHRSFDDTHYLMQEWQ